MKKEKFNFEIAELLNGFNFVNVTVNDNLAVTIDGVDIAEFDPSANRFFITSFISFPINDYESYKKHSKKLKDYFHIVDSFNEYLEENNIVLKYVKYDDKKIIEYINKYDSSKILDESERALYFYKTILKDTNKIKKYVNL